MANCQDAESSANGFISLKPCQNEIQCLQLRPNDPYYLATNLKSFGFHEDRLYPLVGRLQFDTLALPIKPFERCFLSVDQSDYYTSPFSTVG